MTLVADTLTDYAGVMQRCCERGSSMAWRDARTQPGRSLTGSATGHGLQGIAQFETRFARQMDKVFQRRGILDEHVRSRTLKHCFHQTAAPVAERH
jgi:hypothetical protein